ncbi:phage capsid family protein [Lysobacter sp. CA196]|uniref:phage capsid family protein n=1 Tax=Lysobacter sp. CA196 TaxID=3455606 RepID=UPI003F8D0AA3
MSVTDFGRQQPQQKLAWGHKAYEEYVEKFFFTKMLGQGSEAIIEHITELTKNSKGEVGAYFPLIPRITGGGVVGDNQLQGRERTLDSHWQRVNFDQLRNGIKNKGRLADQKSVIQFRRPTRKAMALWLADTWEDQAILTASGISYAFNTDGSPRVTPEGQDPWTDLEYANDVRPPSANRHFRWDAVEGLVPGDTSAIEPADIPVYDMLPEIKARAATKRITPLRLAGKDYYVVLAHENTMARWYRNADFRSTIVNADVRGEANKIFTGAIVTMNGLVIHPYARVYNTLGAAAGLKWGGGNVNGSRTLVLGAQALALADLGVPGWEEEYEDYNNRYGVSINKMGGWSKPQFPSSYDGGSVEDFSVMAIDHAI